LSWETPVVDTALPGDDEGAHEGHGDGAHAGHGEGDAEGGGDAHAGHHGGDMAAGDGQIFGLGGGGTGVGIDGVFGAARAEGLRAPMEIVPAADPARAWTVMEVQRAWPTQRDAVAVDPNMGMSVERLDFADWS